MSATASDRAAAEAPDERLTFPDGFLWGAGTAAYQVEGAIGEDGRAASIWDTFCARPGVVCNGDTGEIAADHYHRYAEDVELMRRIGLDAYRFSVSWPRVQPTGAGPVNAAGLDFYDRLVDALVSCGIDPVLTLYHWDLPQALQDRGGWGARDTAARFADYAEAVADRLGDRVALWTTVNEPWCAAFLGHAAGVHAPGLTDPALSLRAAHHLLLGHGLAVQALRSTLSGDHELSVALNLSPVTAATDSEADSDTARRIDGLLNRMFIEPLLLGGYPADVREDIRHLTDWGFVHEGDERVIASPIDLLGVNYYTPTTVGAAKPSSVPRPWAGAARPRSGVTEKGASPWAGTDGVEFHQPEGLPRTAMGWAVQPRGLYELLLRLHEDYPPIPLIISENGAAYDDGADDLGRVHDPQRVRYLRAHLAMTHEAITAGVDLRGYFVWSLLDNFEWSFGYGKRFGITHVDFENQRRSLKDSALWYRDVIAANAVA
ncbi:glycoside hydrolase family 1 protein [Streptomyces sp. NBC_00829]|uniref:glycoside hydrolase family 1 protein n=1 Tax=Streptomyces sp. NBC_00829 TaxID=2903679 RepID=UPI0038670B81|nr:beta-glucosidase [Streptomyces sp. NBC_00829]